MSAARARVLRALAERGSPTSLAELVEATGLHENTLRGHLAALHDSGEVTRFPARSATRGRPAWRWVARESPYAALARALARGIEQTPGGTAQEAGEDGGRAWGESLREVFVETGRTPHEQLVLALEHVGFSPEVVQEGSTIRLTSCPFLDAARAHPGAVCSVHLGLIEGVLGEPLDASALTPFAEPRACLVQLTDRAELTNRVTDEETT